MKKVILFSCLVVTLFSIFITGCGKVVFNSEDTPTIIPTITTTKPVVPKEIVTPFLINKTVNFLTFDINKKYFNDVNGFAELKLKLPRLEGNYVGIPEINKYFVGKEKFFYEELPLDILKVSNRKIEGAKDNWYRSAEYKLEAVLGDVISISADLNGGAGGVGWPGMEGDSFNLNTGKKLSLGEIFTVSKDEYMNFIYDFVSKKIMVEINRAKQSGYGSLYDFDDAYSIDGSRKIRSFFDTSDFYLSKNALVVFYPQHALGRGPTGPLKFEIPYESILNILDIDLLQIS